MKKYVNFLRFCKVFFLYVKQTSLELWLLYVLFLLFFICIDLTFNFIIASICNLDMFFVSKFCNNPNGSSINKSSYLISGAQSCVDSIFFISLDLISCFSSNFIFLAPCIRSTSSLSLFIFEFFFYLRNFFSSF